MSLGILSKKSVGALGASTLPSRCWNVSGFKTCHAKSWTQARDDCAATGAVDFGGDQGKCIEVMADAYAFNDCVPKYCPEEMKSAPVQVGPIFASGDPCDSTNTIRFVQTVVGTQADGKWGPNSRAAYDKYLASTGKDWYDIAKGCVGEGPYPRKASAPAPAPVPPKPPVTPPVVAPPPAKPGVSRGALLAGIGVVSVLGIGGYYYGQKKGWFQ